MLNRGKKSLLIQILLTNGTQVDYLWDRFSITKIEGHTGIDLNRQFKTSAVIASI